MLFPYKYIPHDIERYQQYLDYLFYQVWLPADPGVVFSDTLLAGHPDLRRIYGELHNVDGEISGKAAQKFSGGIQRIYECFQPLEQAARERLKNGYEVNNEIERLCTDKTATPLTYSDIAANHPDLAKALRVFYDGIYSTGSFFNLKAFGGMYSTVLYEHYQTFTDEGNNDEGICPFCGINGIKGPDDRHREAYDHYLPKGIYPFCALNFRNLVPMCHECNSTEKGTLEPIFTDTKDRNSRVLAYYPFATIHTCPEFSVSIDNPNHATLERENITISVTAPDCDEQVASWFRVFGLERRYLSHLTRKNVGRAWLNMILSAPHRDERTLGDGRYSMVDHDARSMLAVLVSNARLSPITELGFLKAGFLTSCAEIGMFEHLGLPANP